MSIFSKVASVKPSRAVFDLSYEKFFDCDFGQLIPVMCDEVVPGDKFKISSQCIIRFPSALNTPAFLNINAYVHYFFVPYRILWNEITQTYTTDSNGHVLVNNGRWETFISGGHMNVAGGNITLSGDSMVIPRFIPVAGTSLLTAAKHSLWDYFGFPINSGISISIGNGFFQNNTITNFYCYPMAFPWFAYNLIWNEYYRDENLQSTRTWFNGQIAYRNWKKDYFTAGFLEQQKGVAPALPIYGTASLLGNGNIVDDKYGLELTMYTGSAGGNVNAHQSLGNTIGGDILYNNTDSVKTLNGSERRPLKANFTGVDLSNVTSADISDIRTSFQIQKFLERNMRAGSDRYTEFLRAHFGLAPRDETLNRPEYVGGAKFPIMINQVVQTGTTTSGTATAGVGYQAGNALGASRNYIGTYVAKEFGLIMGILSVMPTAIYSQGINRQWLRNNKYDFYFPEFAHLSAQGVYESEIYWTGVGDPVAQTGDFAIFNYQGNYDEMRYKPSFACGELRPNGSYGNYMQQINYGSAPNFNSAFISLGTSGVVDKSAFQNTTGNTMVVEYANIIKAYRPMPYLAEPGLVDHF